MDSVLACGKCVSLWIFGGMERRSDEPDNLIFTVRPYMYGLMLRVLGPLSDPGIGADRPFASGRTLNVYG